MADYIRDLRQAEWGSGVSLHGGNLSCSCPLWVKSRHWSTSAQCPLYPQKRTLVDRVVCFVPKADIRKRLGRNQR